MKTQPTKAKDFKIPEITILYNIKLTIQNKSTIIAALFGVFFVSDLIEYFTFLLTI